MRVVVQSHEKATQSAILKYLRFRGHFVWRNNTGAFRNQKGDFYRMGAVGSPDIIGVKKDDGKFIGIEVKDKHKKPTEEQLAFLKEIVDRGGIGVVAYDLETIMKIL